MTPAPIFAQTQPKLTSPKEIEARVNATRPLLGANIPANLKDRLGTAHYDGHYHLTDKPFLVEGADEIQRLGMNVAKFWLHDNGLPGYGYNSDWSIPLDHNLVDILKHKYFIEAFSYPFTTIILEVFPVSGSIKDLYERKNDFADEEETFYEIASYLLKTYADRDINFILQNWEGDWMLRNGEWAKNKIQLSEAEVQRRSDIFVQFLSARQRGVERARKEAANSRCKVYHAAEVNRVWDGMKGIPTLTTRVLPRVTLDLVSWSSYDGMKNIYDTWQGIELIRQSMRPSPTFGTNAVYIGEVGKPESELSEKEVVEFWDRTMGVFLALNVPFIVHWELYCNEPKDKESKPLRYPRKSEEMRGFWLIRPDGSLSYGSKYLTALLKNAGGKLSQETIESFQH